MPAIIPAIPYILGGLSIATSIYGMGEEQKAIKAETQYKTKASEFEAGKLEEEASEVGQLGVKDELSLISEGKQFVSQQRASMGGTGAVVGAGTSGDLLRESERGIEADVTTLRKTYADEKRRLLDEAKFTRENIDYITSEGRSRRGAASTRTAGRVLGTGATLADRWIPRGA